MVLRVGRAVFDVASPESKENTQVLILAYVVARPKLAAWERTHSPPDYVGAQYTAEVWSTRS